jgi:hypothetical protein
MTIYDWPPPRWDEAIRLENLFASQGLIDSSAIFFWHTSCDTFAVARKFHTSGIARSAADIAVTNLRMATMQMAGMRIPPRVRTVPTLRRRLSVAFVAASAEAVIMRHVTQNLGSPATETQPTQSPRV